MITLEDLKRISPYEWEIPKEYRADMRVPVRIFATRELLEKGLDDKSLEQAVNAATLPGLVGHVLVMPDMHQGYGFPIGGVAATRYPEGVISPGAIGYDINCLTGDARILHEHGYTRHIAEMEHTWGEADLACLDIENSARDAARPVRWFGRKPHAPVLRLTTETGHTLTATADHPFWTPDGMIPCGRLEVGSGAIGYDAVAVSPFEGVPYEAPGDEILVEEHDFLAFIQAQGKSDAGNATGQIIHALRKRGLLPLRFSSPAVPFLCKIAGFLLGDGNLRFDPRTKKGAIACYGTEGDLQAIRLDLTKLGFSPSRVWARARKHRIETQYKTCDFERTEHWITIDSTALALLLAYLGVPAGRKTTQDYGIPPWLSETPRWQKRLFLAAFFGAEMSTPAAVGGHGYNLAAPVISMNKVEGYEASGAAFLKQLASLLADFEVKTLPVAQRAEHVDASGQRTLRLRLVVSAEPENLIRLWSRVGFEYNRVRSQRAATACAYLKIKNNLIAARQTASDQAGELAAAGMSTRAIKTQLAGETVNARFIERSIYEGRQTSPRVPVDYETYPQYSQTAAEGLGESGLVWDRITHVEAIPHEGLVYDVTMDHPGHNFIANGVVVSNCGVRLLGSSIEYEAAKPRLDALATALNRNCPSGVGEKGHLRLDIPELEQVLREGSRWALKKGYATENDLRRTEENGCMAGADPEKVSKRAKDRGRSQVGTLGAGNHFIEVDVVDAIYHPGAAAAMGLQEGCLVVQIHCGSRGFGHQVCTDYVQDLQAAVHKYGIKLPDRELVCAPMDSPEGQAYLGAMRCAANYAFANRQVLAHFARKAFEEVFARKTKNWHLHQVYDIAHNMGKIETHEIGGERIEVCVHRKGATRAFGPGFEGLPSEYRPYGQPVLVPGSMGTASWVLVGTEGSMAQSFGSTCHGAGRVMSRSKAKKTVRGAGLRDELEESGIHIRAGSLAGLAEEAPLAYKDVDAVVEAVVGAGIARQVARLRPVAVIKG